MQITCLGESSTERTADGRWVHTVRHYEGGELVEHTTDLYDDHPIPEIGEMYELLRLNPARPIIPLDCLTRTATARAVDALAKTVRGSGA